MHKRVQTLITTKIEQKNYQEQPAESQCSTKHTRPLAQVDTVLTLLFWPWKNNKENGVSFHMLSE